MPIQLWLVVILIIVLAAPNAFGHGTPLPTVDKDQPAEVAAGAVELLEVLSTHATPLLTSAQAEKLHEAQRCARAAAQIEAGEFPEIDPAEAIHYKAAASQIVTEVCASIQDLVRIDFRPDGHRAAIEQAINVFPQSGCVLLEVVTGDGPAVCRVHKLNVSHIGHNGPVALPVGKACKTYLLLELSELPPGQSFHTLAFEEEGAKEPGFWHAITIDVPPVGQFAFEAVDGDGAHVPVFVRLTAKKTQRLFEPPNAVDLGPIMTSVTDLPIYGPGRGYMHFLPGDMRGIYWVVPGPFSMALPAGEWEVHIQHGVEYVPIVDTFTVDASQWTRKTYSLERWIDMPSRGWFSGDDHVHSRLLHSEDARVLMAFVRAADVHVANILEMGDSARTFYAQRGFGPEFRVQTGDYVLVPGQEDPRSIMGHAIGLNLQELVRDLDKYLLNDWVADEIHKQGGLYGHTHVGEGFLGIHRDMTLLMPRGKSDFASIMQNRLGTSLYYEFLNLGFKLTASAGTDTPYGGAIGLTRLFAFLGDEPFSADAWFDAVKRGRTFVSSGPILDLRVEEAYPGDEIVVEEDRPLRVRFRAEGLPGSSAPARLLLVQTGKVVEELVSSDASQGVLEGEAVLDANHGFWLAAQAAGHNTSEAHTNPVYVTRKGFRHWDFENAEALIQKRLETLDEIEALFAEQETAWKAGALQPLDRWNYHIARQAPEMRERTELVRKIYKELLDTVEVERSLRQEQE